MSKYTTKCQYPQPNVNIHNHYLQPLFTTIIYSHYLQPLFTTIIYSHYLQPLFTTIIYNHYLQPLFITNYNQMSIFLPNYNLYMIKDNSYYKLKYLKYKSKYINYKNLIGGLINEPVLESKAVTILSKPSKPLPLTPQEQQQIELTFREMYPTIDIARVKMIKLPLLKNTPESIKVKVIKFFIFVDMEFTILPYYELQPIIEHIKNNTLFTGDPPTLDKDVKTILENYLKNYYIPKLFINMLKGSKDVNEPIDYISFSSVSISTSYSSLFNDIIKKISEGLLILHIVSGFSDKELHNYSVKYIIDNDRLFKILVESITDDKDVNNGTKILRLFINCIKSSDINVISKKNIIDKINELLIKLHNEYVETTRCNPLFHRLSESSYPKECYKLRNKFVIYVLNKFL